MLPRLSLTSGPNVKNCLQLKFTNVHYKLECLYPAGLSSVMLASEAGAYPRKAPFRCSLKSIKNCLSILFVAT
jgi:hypothetical protein